MTTVVASAAAQNSTAPQVPAWVQTDQAVQNFVAQPSGQVRSFRNDAAISKGYGFDSVVIRQGSGQVVVNVGPASPDTACSAITSIVVPLGSTMITFHV